MIRKRLGIVAAVLVGIVVTSTVASLILHGPEAITEEVLSPLAEQARGTLQGYPVAGPVLFIGVYVLSVLLLIPGALMTILSGMAFGLVLGTLYVAIAATIAMMIAFFIGRYAVYDVIQNQAEGGVVVRIKRGIEKQGARFVAFMRLVPVIPYSMQNYLFGVTRIGFGSYIVISWLCMLPGIIANVYIGYAGRQLVVGGMSMGRVYTIVGIGIGLALFVSMLPTFVRAVMGDMDELDEPGDGDPNSKAMTDE